MSKRFCRIMLCLIVAVLLPCVSLAAETPPPTITGDITEDTVITEDTIWSGGKLEANLTVNEGCTLTLLSSVCTSSSKPVVISGKGTVLRGFSGSNADSMFYVGKTATFQDITLDGNKQNFGTSCTGSIITASYIDQLTIDNCTLQNNKSSSYGAIHLGEGKATIRDSVIQYNNANYGAGINVRQSCVLLATNTVISNNSAVWNGGGLYLEEYKNQVTLDGLTITHNSAEGGGGIYSQMQFEVSNSVISQNHANRYGGGVYVQKSASFRDCTITRNSAVSSGGGLDCFYSPKLSGTMIISGNTKGTGKEGEPASNTAESSIILDGPLGEDSEIWVSNYDYDFPGAIQKIVIASADPSYNEGVISVSDAQKFYSDNGKYVVALENGILFLVAPKNLPISMNEVKYASLENALRLAPTGSETHPTEITVLNDIVLEQPIIFPTNKYIKIVSNSSTKYKIIRGSDTFSINLPEGSWLTLENIIIDGSKTDYPISQNSLIQISGGTLTMNQGVLLQNNSTANHGGAIYLEDGIFNLTGGRITGNQAALSGGSVHACGGTFQMSGGSITGNYATSNAGISIVNGAEFGISGGSISDNTLLK